MNKNYLIKLIIFFSVYTFLIPSNPSITITLPLRIDPGKIKPYRISPEGFRLFVNKKPVDIKNIVREENIFGKKQLLGRNFILSFGNFSKYDKTLSDGLSYFVTELLDPADSLIIVTPGKLFQIKISKNREKMIYNIDNILTKYFNAFSRQISQYTKGINTELSRLKNYFENYDPGNIATNEAGLYSDTLTKLSTEIDFFKINFIYPTKKNLDDVKKLLYIREGEKIWIHFQNSTIYPFEKTLQNSFNWIKYHMSMTTTSEESWQKVISTKLHTLERTLLVSDIFPKKALIRKFIDTNISLYSIYIKNPQSREGVFSVLSADIENIFSNISQKTGGLLSLAQNSESALRKLIGHRNVFFKFSFDIDKTPRDKNITITPIGKDHDLFYKHKITSSEFLDILKYNLTGKLKIKSYKKENKKISFIISSFTEKKDEKIGLIKVIINLSDQNKKRVYFTSNILRATKKEISVNVSLPPTLTGNYFMKISLIDLISNRMISKESQITL